MKKVLHITNWYPNNWNDLEAIFIKEQFKLFSEVTFSHLIHIQVRTGTKLLEYKYFKYSNSEEGYYLLTKIKSHKIIELLTTFLLWWVLFKVNYRKYDLIHFHIAYPLLTYYHLWKKIVKTPIIISEHWSAYHFNFYMPKNSKKLNSIKRIFKQNIPLITVSKALLNDIEIFSGKSNFLSIVIPNVINKNIFKYKNILQEKTPIFFIVNIWSEIKNPFPLLEGFVLLNKNKIKFHLNIGGYGNLINEMKQFVKLNSLEDKVSFLGKMNKIEIAKEYNKADAYLFSSKYETFSIVCAEALCSGTPLIGLQISSILEYTNLNDIIIIKENNANAWLIAINNFIKKRDTFDREKISKRYSNYFTDDNIQIKYINFIERM